MTNALLLFRPWTAQLTPLVSLADKYYIKLDALEADLTTETPTWILSAYAPGREAPDQLFGGPMREQSFEEMRLHYMKGKAEGNEQKAVCTTTPHTPAFPPSQDLANAERERG